MRRFDERDNKPRRPSLFGEMLQRAQVKQATIARLAGVSRPYVHDVYWGHRPPSRKLMRALSEVERLRVERARVDPITRPHRGVQ
jgi:hypothetical protein